MYDIYFDLNMHQTVHSASDENFSFELDFGTTDNETDDYAVIVRRSVGCICSKCGESYPYAEPNQSDGSFRCYSCRKFG